jgi:hypothetical protein
MLGLCRVGTSRIFKQPCEMYCYLAGGKNLNIVLNVFVKLFQVTRTRCMVYAS